MKDTYIHAQDFIQKEIPPALQREIPRACMSAYRAVGELVGASDFLQAPSAQYGRGHLVSWAVDFAIEALLKSGRWPFDYKWEFYEQPTGKYLKIFTESAVVTLNQLPEQSSVPRHASFRSNFRFNNQLFLELPEFENEIDTTERPHLIIGHGYQTLTFAQICVPHPDVDEHYWLYRTPNLLRGLYEASEDFPQDALTEEVIVTLKERAAERFGNAP